MNLTSLNTGKLKLDGGAMFGVVPKVLWNAKYPADENNQVTLTMRCLLIETDSKKIIIDTGIGEKLDDKKKKIYQLEDIIHLEKLLAEKNIAVDEITDVILTHLHFDHCGGSVKYDTKGRPVPVFPKAMYTVSKAQWNAATIPNKRERASYFGENFLPIEENGQLNIIEKNIWFTDNIELRLYNGHTDGQIIPFIKYYDKTIVYVADLLPSAVNIPLSWITAYDMQPLVALEEKEAFLNEAVKEDYILFFEHDLYNECCTLVNTEKGIRAGKTFDLKEVLS